jgi:hypothetical protein
MANPKDLGDLTPDNDILRSTFESLSASDQ